MTPSSTPDCASFTISASGLEGLMLGGKAGSPAGTGWVAGFSTGGSGASDAAAAWAGLVATVGTAGCAEAAVIILGTDAPSLASHPPRKGKTANISPNAARW